MSADMSSLIVAMIALTTVVISFFSWLPEPEYTDYVRTVLACVLSWYLYRGKEWARLLSVVLYTLASIIGVLTIAAFGIDGANIEPMIIVTAIYAASAILLNIKRVVGPHFDS